MPEYELKPEKPMWGGDKEIIHYLDLFGKKSIGEPTPAETARQQGQAGYNLGKAARFLTKP